MGSLRDAGAERQTLELIAHLDRKQFDVSLISMEPNGVERAREFTEKCFVLGVPEAGNRRWQRRGLSLGNAIWKTRRQLLRWKTQVLHAMLPGPSIIGAVAGRWAQVPIQIGSRLCMTHLYRPKGGLVAAVDKMAFRMATVNIANSVLGSKDMVVVGGCPASKCATIYNGVDTKRFHPTLPRDWRNRMEWGDEHVVYGTVANFRSYKRHIDLVHAAQRMVKRHPNARFVLVGADFGSRSSVLAEIERLSLQDKFCVLDSDPFPEKLFAAMDVYVSTSETEGFSNVILEAMACGKPVIATCVGGNPEAIVEGATGFLVPCAAPDRLAEAAENLFRDPVLRRRMGSAGRKRVEGEFSLERMIERHQELYLQLFTKWKRIEA
jgi:glycosyltransferase involved in cell wall biosynthesis